MPLEAATAPFISGSDSAFSKTVNTMGSKVSYKYPIVGFISRITAKPIHLDIIKTQHFFTQSHALFKRSWCCSEIAQDFYWFIKSSSFQNQSGCFDVWRLNEPPGKQRSCIISLWWSSFSFLFSSSPLPVCFPASSRSGTRPVCLREKNEEDFDIREITARHRLELLCVLVFFISSSELQYFIKKEKYL